MSTLSDYRERAELHARLDRLEEALDEIFARLSRHLANCPTATDTEREVLG